MSGVCPHALHNVNTVIWSVVVTLAVFVTARALYKSNK
jgi:hypothetical protein